MIPVDFHCHSLFSHCGLHTVVELLGRARELGLEGLAVTDHGPRAGGRWTTVFFERLRDPVPGVRLLKGMECNLGERPGEIDLPAEVLPWIDLVLLGLHGPPGELGAGAATDLLLEAMAGEPAVDVIVHPEDPAYRVDLRRLARGARERGVALELNNSKVLLGRWDPAQTRALVRACRDEGCLLALGSDAHALGEVGRDEEVRPFLAGFPEELLVNADAGRAFAFVAARRGNKESRVRAGPSRPGGAA